MSTKLSGRPMGLATSIRAPVADKLRTVQSTLPPSLNASTPCLNTLCRGATRFSRIASFMAVARTLLFAGRRPHVAICVVQISASKLKSNKCQQSPQGRAIYNRLTIIAINGRYSIANALETIATALLSAALESVTRPKLIVRPRRTTRASASTSDDATARMKCVV